MVKWVHEIHVGKSIFSGGVTPHIIEIGEVHVRP